MLDLICVAIQAPRQVYHQVDPDESRRIAIEDLLILVSGAGSRCPNSERQQLGLMAIQFQVPNEIEP